MLQAMVNSGSLSKPSAHHKRDPTIVKLTKRIREDVVVK
jgi:hypothetical protein